MDTRRLKRNAVMRDLFDELYPSLSERIELLLNKTNPKTLEQFQQEPEYREDVKTNLAWLTTCRQVEKIHALCMIFTVIKLIFQQKGIELKCKASDATARKLEMANIITNEVNRYLAKPKPMNESSQLAMHRYVLMLLTDYHDLRESCGSLFIDREDNLDQLRDTGPAPVRELKTMEEWQECDVMQELFDWVWLRYEKLINKYKSEKLSWSNLSGRGTDSLIEHFHERLTGRFQLSEIAARAMVQTVAYLIRQQLTITGTATRVLTENEEAQTVSTLAQAVLDDLQQGRQRRRKNQRKTRDLISRLLASYSRGQLIRRHRRRGQ